jgi:glycosyltransferase involved in cell wall biosynthesis
LRFVKHGTTDEGKANPLMRVLFVDQSGQCGGAELMLLDLLNGLRLKLEPRVVLFDDGPFAQLLAKDGLPVDVLPLKLQATKSAGKLSSLLDLPLLMLLALKLAWRARWCDIIYANTPKAMVAGSLASRLSGKQLVFHLHDILTTDHFSIANIRLLVNLANIHAAAVIANSKATKAAFVNAGGRAELATVIYNGFNLQQRSIDRTSARQVLGWPDAQPVAVIVGRIAEWKGQHILIQALLRSPDWKACIVGDALFTKGDQDYKRRLMEMAEDPALSGRLIFVGFVEDPHPYFVAADVVVHCSTAPEPFGRVIVEGMLAGRPVIATNCGGATEILHDEFTGYLVPPNDVSALAATLKHLLTNPENTDRTARAGQENARQRFGLELVTQQTLAVLCQARRP